MGNSKRLSGHAHVQCISAQPSYGIPWPGRVNTCPRISCPDLRPDAGHDNLWIETEDAYAMTRWWAAMRGLLAGMSSGANLHAAREVAKRLAKERPRGRDRHDRADGATNT